MISDIINKSYKDIEKIQERYRKDIEKIKKRCRNDAEECWKSNSKTV